MADLDHIRQIAKELNVKLKELAEIKPTSQGYTINQHGRVTGVGLHYCKIEDLNRIIIMLRSLPELTQLYLRSNQLRGITALGVLTTLTQLDVSRNQISDFAPLQTLSRLTELAIRSNQLSDLTTLSILTSLEDLNLYDNQVSDITPLKDLKNLKRLLVHTNQLSNISPLKYLENLTILHLDDNQIDDISSLKDLKNLRVLSLSGNRITDISVLQNLKNLYRLYLQKNFIVELPPWITNFEMEITTKPKHEKGEIVHLGGNPLKTPPPEIVKQGKEAVRNYFAQLQTQEEDYLFEAKMLIVGEPGAGKTSMAYKIENGECELPKDDDTTRGIDVTQYYFPLQPENFKGFKHPEKLTDRQFRVNLWDFGGQEIYKATHRFFLSKRSLYALVADSRKEDTDFNYWLHIVEMFGGESPLLIVQNEKTTT